MPNNAFFTFVVPHEDEFRKTELESTRWSTYLRQGETVSDLLQSRKVIPYHIANILRKFH